MPSEKLVPDHWLEISPPISFIFKRMASLTREAPYFGGRVVLGCFVFFDWEVSQIRPPNGLKFIIYMFFSGKFWVMYISIFLYTLASPRLLEELSPGFVN